MCQCQACHLLWALSGLVPPLDGALLVGPSRQPCAQLRLCLLCFH